MVVGAASVSRCGVRDSRTASMITAPSAGPAARVRNPTVKDPEAE
jgi:hypothetical protein